ncbi:TIGR01777 family protein [Methylophaga sp. 42_25_T18]|nr:TIGR01777 family protein [Methylophaga sp. 42_25_T18]OUR85935.1 TIGR01777 family protein [Methylophaga sp. 42_8_T64]
MAHYLITGGTGLIGSALCHHLINSNHDVTVLSRQPVNVPRLCGDKVYAVTSFEDIDDQIKFDGVINLAGASIADRHWTQKRKAILEQSRVGITADLVTWIKQRELKPNCLISGSAVGWYGDGSNKILTESSDFHDEYTHQLCDNWEKQALLAQDLDVRVCIVRTGLVLARKGGFLQKMLLPFKMGLGGHLGDGLQYMSWIHINDMIKLILFLLEKQNANGIFNACSPTPISNKVFSQALAKQLNRPAFLPVPAWLLKGVLAEMSRLLLTGQRAVPEKAQALGFQFDYTELNSALADILSSK